MQGSDIAKKRRTAAVLPFAMLWALVYLAPPISLSFTNTDSKIWPGILYIAVWMPLVAFLKPRKLFGSLPMVRDLPSILWTLLTVFLCFHSAYLYISGNGLSPILEMQFAAYTLAGYVTTKWAMDEGYGDTLLTFLAYAGAIESVAGIVSSVVGPLYPWAVQYYGGRFGFSLYRACGTTDSANVLGGLIAFSTAIWFDRYLTARKPSAAFTAVFWVSLGAVCEFLTQSRSGLICTVVAMIYLIAARSHRMFRSGARVRLFLTISSLVVLLIISAIMAPEYWTDVNYIFHAYDEVRASAKERVWYQFVNGSTLDQWIGVGFRQSSMILNKVWLTAHNNYLSFLAEIGVIGSALFFGALLGVSWRFLKTQPVLFAGILILAIHNYTETFFYSCQYMVLAGYLVGIGSKKRLSRKAADALPRRGRVPVLSMPRTPVATSRYS